MGDRVRFVLDPHGFATGERREIEYLSLLLPPEAVKAGGGIDLSITVEVGRWDQHFPTLILHTDCVPGELAIQLVDGRGNTHDLWERDDVPPREDDIPPGDFVPWTDADRAADFGDLLGRPDEEA